MLSMFRLAVLERAVKWITDQHHPPRQEGVAESITFGQSQLPFNKQPKEDIWYGRPAHMVNSPALRNASLFHVAFAQTYTSSSIPVGRNQDFIGLQRLWGRWREPQSPHEE